MTLLAVASIVLVLDGQLVLRRGQTPPPGRIVSVTTEGVAVEDDAGVRTLVGWDRVRSITGEFEQQGRTFRNRRSGLASAGSHGARRHRRRGAPAGRVGP
ncbi:MAG: hypothetical protein IH985_06340 [Planctomycetes bacterium]|nr:hypothetical protein [Planctomycetota bacterium]